MAKPTAVTESGATGAGPGAASSPALELDSIQVRFGGIAALDGVSMRVETGQRWAVIGPNGAGKTTLFRVISGEQRATAGSVALFGAHCTRWSQQRRARFGLGRTFQINNVFTDLTVEQNLVVSAQATGREHFRCWRPVVVRGELRDRVEQALDRTGLSARRNDLAVQLSHGEARQLEVALALARESRILLLDEPAAGLAAPERKLMKELIERLPRTVTVVLIEHDMGLALDVVDRVLCLNNGTPVASGTPAEIRDDERVQQIYLGTNLGAGC